MPVGADRYIAVVKQRSCFRLFFSRCQYEVDTIVVAGCDTRDPVTHLTQTEKRDLNVQDQRTVRQDTYLIVRNRKTGPG